MTTKKELFKSGAYKEYYALLAALITIPVFLLIFYFSGKLPGGEDIFLYGGLRTQFIAFAKLFWRSLLRGEGIDYTFHVSLGMPSIPLYTFYSLSPFNILYILIDHVELASVVLVVLKLSLAAYTFQCFSAKVLKNDSISSVAFAVAYALNGYVLMFYFNIPHLDGVYMLPVIAMLIADLVKEGRCVKLALAYAYVFVTQFYDGYIIGFFSLLFFLLLSIMEYRKEWKKYITALVGFGISVVTAALIGGVFLYPTAKYLLSDFRDIISSDWGLNCNILDIYKNLFMGQYQTMVSPYPYIYCGVMTLYLVPCFFADRGIKKEYKLIASAALGYLLVCSLWLPGYQFMHAFDVPDGFGFRFAYFYPFVLLAIGCMEWKNMDSKKIRELVLLCIIQIAVYLVLGFGEQNVTIHDRVSNIIFLIIICIIFIFINKYGMKRMYQIVFIGIVCAELLINGILVVGKVGAPQTDAREVYQAFSDVNNRAVDEIKSYDPGFYRIVNKNPYDPNDSALNDYCGMVYFSTIENVGTKETLGLLGYVVTPRIGGDNGGTPLTEMLLSQKYEIVVNSSDYVLGRSDDLWRINEKTLSLGYMVSDELLNITLDSDNAFENQNVLAGGLTGRDIAVFVPYEGNFAGITENMSILYNGESYGLVPDDGKTEGSVIMRLEDDSALPVYAYFAQDKSLWLAGSVYFSSGEEDQIRLWISSSLSLPQIIKLGKDSEGKYYVGIYFDEDHMIYNYYKAAYFYCYDDAAVDRAYDLLKDHQMNILEMKGSDITAEINVPSDKHILFTSIPYDEGWHILVDGREAETLSVVNDTFLAVELTEGHHELKFYYDSAVNRTGAILSICGIVFVIGLLFAEKRNAKKPTVKDHSTISTKEKQTTPEQRSEIY